MDLEQAKTLALTYLKEAEQRHMEAAEAFLAPGARLTFPGGRTFSTVAEIVANSSGRYRSVRKRVGRCEAWQAGDAIGVLVTGTLYGEWQDGLAFEDIRFIDVFEIADGLIRRQEVWNDTGERVLAGRGKAVA